MTEENNILNELYHTAKMGVVSISEVVKNVQEESMKTLILDQMQFYSELKDKTKIMLTQAGEEVSEISNFGEMFQKLMVKMKATFDKSHSHVADMMIQGTLMGITNILMVYNKIKRNLDTDIVKIVEEALQKQSDFIEDLKEYL